MSRTPEPELPKGGSPAQQTTIPTPVPPAPRTEVGLPPKGTGSRPPTPNAPGERSPSLQAKTEEQARALIALYEKEVKARGNDRSAAPLFHQMGRLWEIRLRNPRHAAACYQSAYNLDPSYRPNLGSARRLFAQVGNWQMVEQLLDAEIRVAAPPLEPRDGGIPKAGATLSNPLVRGLLMEKASLLAERLGRAPEATQILEQLQAADAHDPTPGTILEGLESIEAGASTPEREANLADRAQLFVQLAEAVTDAPLRVYYLTAAAALHDEQLAQPDEAATLYRRALELGPRDPAAIAGVKLHAERQGRWDELLQVLYGEAKVERGSTAAAILYQAARLCSEKLGRDGDALEALVVARKHAPQDPLVLSELARRYEQAERLPELAEVLSARAAGCRNLQEAVEVQLKLAALYEERLDREEDAISCYRTILAAAPSNTTALASLGKLYARRGMWQELLWTYEQETAAATDSRTRTTKLYKAAEVLEQRLDRADDAIARYTLILSQQPGYLPAQQALNRILERQNRLPELCALLQRELIQTEDRDQRISLRTQIARLYSERLGDLDKAIKTLAAAIEEAPDHLPTIRTFARLCEQAQRWRELLWANGLESGLVGDQKQVISLLHRNGEILEEKLGDKDGAMEAYQKVLALSPSYLPALKALGKLYAQKGRWEELVVMYRQEAEVAQTPEEAAVLILRVGELYEGKLLRENEALGAYREVLSLSPGHLPALSALQRIYRAQGNWEGLLDMLRAEAEVRPDAHERAPVLFALGEIAEQRSDRKDLAANAYEEVLRSIPDHAPARRALERLYTAAASWRELGLVYERELANTSLLPARAALCFKLGQLSAERLGDPAKAAQYFEAALGAAEPEMTLAALKALERLRGGPADRAKRADARAMLAARLGDKRLASQLELAAGRDRERAGTSQIPGQASGRTPSEPHAAASNFQRALELWPESEAAASALEAALRKTGDVHRLAELLQSRLDRWPPGAGRAEAALELAEICADDLQKPQRALQAALVGLGDEPQSLPLLRQTRLLQAAVKEFGAAHATALAEAEVAREPQLGTETLLWAAALAKNELEDTALAIADYRRILDRDPLQREAARALADLLIGSGDTGALLEIQDRQAQALLAKRDPGAPAALVETAARIASVSGDWQRALQRLDQAVELQPEYAPAVFARGELLLRLERVSEAAEAYRHAAELVDTPRELAEAHLRLGVILQERLDSPTKAAAQFQAVISAVPGHAEALERLAKAHESNGNWTGADYALRQLEAATSDPAVQARAMLAHARVLLDGRGDEAAALALVQKTHGLLSENPKTLTLLCNLEERLRDWEGAAKTCERIANLAEATDAATSRGFRMQAGEIYSQRLRRLPDAVRSYHRALDLDPSDEGARIALADLYASDPMHLNDAVTEHRWLLRADPARADSYRSLFRIFTAQQQTDRAYCAAAVMGFLQLADDKASNVHAEVRRRLPAEPAAALSAEQRERLLTHPDGRGPLGAVLRILGEYLDKIAPWPASSYPLARGDRLKPEHPVRHLAEALAKDLGGVDCELFQGKSNELAALPTSPPALVIGPAMVRRFQSREQRFLVGRLLSRVQDGSQIAAFVTPDWICDLVGAAQKLVQPNGRITVGKAGPQLDELERRLQKHLPRKARKNLEELLASPLRVPPDGGLSWACSLLPSSDRSGLLFAIDVASGLSAALNTEEMPAPDSVAQAVRERADLAELCRFAVSEDFFQLRNALRLNVG